MIEFSSEEIELLLRTSSLPPDLQQKLETARERPVVLKDEERDLLLDVVTNRLMTHGFDESYRPTADGNALERIVDRLTASRQE